jgi:hypothetical protein
MRYVPFALLCLIGLTLGIAGVVGLGIGAAYAGAMLAILGAGGAYTDHVRREGPRTH